MGATPKHPITQIKTVLLSFPRAKIILALFLSSARLRALHFATALKLPLYHITNFLSREKIYKNLVDFSHNFVQNFT
jgi:hypothetical protein